MPGSPSLQQKQQGVSSKDNPTPYVPNNPVRAPMMRKPDNRSRWSQILPMSQMTSKKHPQPARKHTFYVFFFS